LNTWITQPPVFLNHIETLLNQNSFVFIRENLCTELVEVFVANICGKKIPPENRRDLKYSHEKQT